MEGSFAGRKRRDLEFDRFRLVDWFIVNLEKIFVCTQLNLKARTSIWQSRTI